MWLRGHSHEIDPGGLLAPVKMAGRRRIGLRAYWITVGLILGLDQGSKWLVSQTMGLGQTFPLAGDFFKLTYVQNAGAAFSFLANANPAWRLPLFVGIAGAAAAALTVLAYRERSRGAGLLFSLGLVSGGALGNLLDRVRLGTVIDFLEFSYRAFHWPVFNFADSAVVLGVLALTLRVLREPKGRR